MTDDTSVSAALCPYRGSERIVSALTLGAFGTALIAFFGAPLVAVAIVIAWLMGLLAGLHLQSIREHARHGVEVR